MKCNKNRKGDGASLGPKLWGPILKVNGIRRIEVLQKRVQLGHQEKRGLHRENWRSSKPWVNDQGQEWAAANRQDKSLTNRISNKQTRCPLSPEQQPKQKSRLLWPRGGEAVTLLKVPRMEPETAALCPRRTPPYLGGPHPPAPCSSHTGTASLYALPRDAGLGGDSATPLSRPRPATYESQQRSSFRSKQTRSTDHGGRRRAWRESQGGRILQEHGFWEHTRLDWNPSLVTYKPYGPG